jgi:hypothetical protein
MNVDSKSSQISRVTEKIKHIYSETSFSTVGVMKFTGGLAIK